MNYATLVSIKWLYVTRGEITNKVLLHPEKHWQPGPNIIQRRPPKTLLMVQCDGLLVPSLSMLPSHIRTFNRPGSNPLAQHSSRPSHQSQRKAEIPWFVVQSWRRSVMPSYRCAGGFPLALGLSFFFFLSSFAFFCSGFMVA